MNLQELTLNEALVEFPSIIKVNSFKELSNVSYDFFLCALGFEERTLSIPENLAILANEENFTCNNAIYFTYATSTTDNAFNEPRLKAALESFKDNHGSNIQSQNMFCDEEQFSLTLLNLLKARILEKGQDIKIILDISVCSSKLILSLFKLLFELRQVDLLVLYTEAKVYYPLYEEFIEDKTKLLADSDLSTTNGYEDIINSNEYSEGAKESSDLVIAFAPFKVGRINKIVSDIDESILLNNDNRLIWIIGEPNFEKDEDKVNRKQMLKEINGIIELKENIYDVSTLDYKETLHRLELIYQNNLNYHINIADLGSKMQTIGISIFYHIRPDVSVYYALPLVYNSSRYSHGAKCHWKIDFTNFSKYIELIKKIDELEISYTNPQDKEFYE